jgi:hypothetical protein
VLIREITLAECFEALSRTSFARLACAKDNQPYVVPVHLAFHEEEGNARLFGFTIPGQKAEWLRANPLVCVEVDEVAGSDWWLSIVVFGRYEELPDTPDCAVARRLAIRLLQGTPCGGSRAPPFTNSAPAAFRTDRSFQSITKSISTG